MRNNNLIQEEINRARHLWGYDTSKTIFEQATGNTGNTGTTTGTTTNTGSTGTTGNTFVGQTWKNAFKTRMASKFGPPGATRLNQITQARKPQALRFLVKTKAKLVNKRNNVNAGSAHYNQLTYKIDNVTMIARNMYQTVI